MVIEAPLSSYKKKNIILITCILIGMGGWFFYDANHNSKFIDKHTVDGVPDSTLTFNLKSPPYLVGAGIILGIYFFVIKGKKIVADGDGLNTGKETIAYDTIEKINKTHFDSKGYFVLTYTDSGGQSKDLKISDRTYDNLPAVLDHLVAKIS
jgi:hypothetical protein